MVIIHADFTIKTEKVHRKAFFRSRALARIAEKVYELSRLTKPWAMGIGWQDFYVEYIDSHLRGYQAERDAVFVS